jgi:hypothetical protein
MAAPIIVLAKALRRKRPDFEVAEEVIPRETVTGLDDARTDQQPKDT